MNRDLDATYLANFPDVLNGVVSEVFSEPLMVAGGLHVSFLFGPDQIAMAAVAGCISGLTELEAVAALVYLEWASVRRHWLKCIFNGNARKRYADLQQLAKSTFALIECHLGSDGKVNAFAAEMVQQMQSS